MTPMLTRDVLLELDGVTEDRLRSAIRRGRLTPERMSNGLYIWTARELERARILFRSEGDTKADIPSRTDSKEQ